MTNRLNISLTRWDTYRQEYILEEQDWITITPVNLTWCNIKTSFKYQNKILITKDGIITTPLEGKFEIYLTPEETSIFNNNILNYDVEITYANNDKETLFLWVAEVLLDITI